MGDYSKFVKKAVTPTITAGAYSANDVVGGLLTFDFDSDITVNGGIARHAVLTDKGTVAAALKLYLFDTVPATIADNGAFAPSDADILSCFAQVTLSTYASLTNNRICFSDAINRDFVTDNGKIYGYLVADATPTYASTSDLTLTLRILSE